MAQQNINTGATGSGSGGDTARTAFEKTQANFTDLYANKQNKSDNLMALAGANGAAGMRGVLELGNAAQATLMSGPDDFAAGRVMTTGAAGLGVKVHPIYNGDLNALDSTRFNFISPTCANNPTAEYGNVLTQSGDTAPAITATQIFITLSGRFLTRCTNTGVWSSQWDEHLTTKNASSLPILGSLSASTDNTRSIGEAAHRWSTVYAGTGTINTSDAREKTEVRALTDAEIVAARQLAQEIGAYKFLAAVAEKGTAARDHIGLTVQRAIEILQANGLSPFNYGFICYDSWPQETVDHPATYEQVPVTDAGGNVTGYENGVLIKEAWTEVTQEAGDRYSFRTDELNLFIARGQAAYLAQLETRIAALEPTA